jgi:Putative prokaryotic signal transducing protein
MKQIYSARDEVDAEMVKNALGDAEIDSVIQGGGLSAVLGAIPVTEASLPSIWVRDEDSDRAAKVLAEFQRPPAPEGAPWKCPQCGEMIDPQFTACWNCGTARPDSSPT